MTDITEITELIDKFSDCVDAVVRNMSEPWLGHVELMEQARERLLAAYREQSAELAKADEMLKAVAAQCEAAEREVIELREKLRKLEEQEPIKGAVAINGATYLVSHGDEPYWIEKKGAVRLYTTPKPAPLSVPEGWELVPTELGSDLYDACYRACAKGYGFGGLDEIMEKIEEAYRLKPLIAAAPQPKESSHD